jgi:hypothetical protein
LVAVQQRRLLYRKRFSSAAKSFAVREMVLQYSKIVCSTGNGLAVRQNRLLYRKWFSSAAKSFAVQETV